jgi:SAM-dependent methyltransferase
VRNREQWRPSKVVRDVRSGRYMPSPTHVGVGSRFVSTLTIDEYVRLIRTYASGVLLDCGCGAVPYYEIYVDLVAENVCIDWEHTAHGHDYIDEYVDLNGPLPFSDDSFDTVLLADVLAHIARPWSLVPEIARVLRPGGVLILGTPFLYWLNEQPHDYYRYTEFGLRRFCDDSGLDVVELEPYGGYPDVLLDLISKMVVRGERTARLLLAVAGILGRTGVYRRLRERTKTTFPLGYFLVARKP